jgi:acyl-[acyl-carrier-protein]-phospholipid O-acyltransferase/long-chain-fatty-acid--[acyl-carrier-protein] ligase
MHETPQIAVAGWRRGFWCLMVTQFQNAFSDNALKQLIILVLLASAATSAGEAEQDRLVALVTAVFSAPFILFAMLGGWMADRFSKQRVMVGVKLAEVAIMAVAAFALASGNLYMKLSAIFLMGCHSAIFAPAKYGILPEILPHAELSWGNGILELLTFLGVILGTVAAGYFADAFQGREWVVGPILMAIAVVGWMFSRQVTPVPPADPRAPVRINPVTDLWRQLRHMKADRDLWRACWGNTGFYFISALVMMNVVVFGRNVLHLSGLENSMMNVWLALGIGLGSVVAGYASRGRIEYRLVPVGAVGLALSTIPMGMAGVTKDAFSVCMFALGFFAGLFIVPIVAVLQHRPSAESKGAVQGTVSSLSFLGILAAAGVQWVAREQLHITSGQVFWLCGFSAVATGAYAAISRGRFIQAE